MFYVSQLSMLFPDVSSMVTPPWPREQQLAELRRPRLCETLSIQGRTSLGSSNPRAPGWLRASRASAAPRRAASISARSSSSSCSQAFKTATKKKQYLICSESRTHPCCPGTAMAMWPLGNWVRYLEHRLIGIYRKS